IQFSLPGAIQSFAMLPGSTDFYFLTTTGGLWDYNNGQPIQFGLPGAIQSFAMLPGSTDFYFLTTTGGLWDYNNGQAIQFGSGAQSFFLERDGNTIVSFSFRTRV